MISEERITDLAKWIFTDPFDPDRCVNTIKQALREDRESIIEMIEEQGIACCNCLKHVDLIALADKLREKL